MRCSEKNAALQQSARLGQHLPRSVPRAIHGLARTPPPLITPCFAPCHRWLSHSSMLNYFRTLLTRYAGLFNSPHPLPSEATLLQRGFTRISSEADLLRLTNLCPCPTFRLMGGNRTLWNLLRREARECFARGSREAEEMGKRKCTLWPPLGGGYCGPLPKCCVGWDCGLQPLGCGTNKGMT